MVVYHLIHNYIRFTNYIHLYIYTYIYTRCCNIFLVVIIELENKFLSRSMVVTVDIYIYINNYDYLVEYTCIIHV